MTRDSLDTASETRGQAEDWAHGGRFTMTLGSWQRTHYILGSPTHEEACPDREVRFSTVIFFLCSFPWISPGTLVSRSL